MDRRLWQIGVLGSECLDWRSSHRAWIEDRESGSTLMADRSSSHHAWIGDRENGSALMADRCAWIRVLGSVLFSSCLDQRSSRRRAPCLDRNFKKFGIERSEKVGIESSFKENSRTESREWRERGS